MTTDPGEAIERRQFVAGEGYTVKKVVTTTHVIRCPHMDGGPLSGGRYHTFIGPGTYYEDRRPSLPRLRRLYDVTVCGACNIDGAFDAAEEYEARAKR